MSGLTEKQKWAKEEIAKKQSELKLGMSEEMRDKWIEALRSGKYDQGYCELYTPPADDEARGSFCCLGVFSHAVLGSDLDSIEHSSYLPVLETKYINWEDQELLGHMNDDISMSFDQIAEVLEKVECNFPVDKER